MTSEDISDPGHGHSPAAWIAVVMMLAGFVVGVFGFWFVSMWLIWLAVALVVLGPLVGWILAKAGYGVAGPRYQPKSSH